MKTKLANSLILSGLLAIGAAYVAPQPAQATAVCGRTCETNADCPTGLVCFDGQCRNPWCPAAVDCTCVIAGNIDIDVQQSQEQEQEQNVDVDQDVDVNVENNIDLESRGEVLGMKVPSVTPVTGGGADAAIAGLFSIPLVRLGLLLRKFRG